MLFQKTAPEKLKTKRWTVRDFFKTKASRPLEGAVKSGSVRRVRILDKIRAARKVADDGERGPICRSQIGAGLNGVVKAAGAIKVKIKLLRWNLAWLAKERQVCRINDNIYHGVGRWNVDDMLIGRVIVTKIVQAVVAAAIGIHIPLAACRAERIIAVGVRVYVSRRKLIAANSCIRADTDAGQWSALIVDQSTGDGRGDRQTDKILENRLVVGETHFAHLAEDIVGESENCRAG